MPVQPCPACREQTTRLLTEVSRFAVVWYYRCDSCGHVWTINKDTGLIHHVTPLNRDETELHDGQPNSVVVWSHETASWLESQLVSGLTLIRSASAADSQFQERSLQRAEEILKTVRRFLPASTLTRDEARGLLANFHQLDEAIQQLKGREPGAAK